MKIRFNTANLAVGKRYWFKLLNPADGSEGYPIAGNLAEVTDTTIKVVDYQIGHLPQMGDLTLTVDRVASIENFSGKPALDWRIVDPPPVIG